MSGIFGETLTFSQESGDDVKLVVFGDEKYARYETLDGYTAVYDDGEGLYCYARRDEDGRFASSGAPVEGPPPDGVDRHLREDVEVRRRQRFARFEAMVLPEDAVAAGGHRHLLTFGPSGGLLPGTPLSTGNVVGLTILITFPDTPTTVTAADVNALLNAPNYTANGNKCSVNEYFKTMSTNRLDYTNVVVGPFQMSKPRLFYASQQGEGQLVPEALDLAVNAGVQLHQFDSLGRRIVDSVCIMYAGQTVYQGDLWPHNWVFRHDFGGVRTELYIVTSMGRTAADLSIGTFCHEAGHMLCRFPDLYDYGDITREGDDFESAGIGYFCVMGGGNHLDHGRTPSPVIGYLRDLAGWCGNEVDLSQPGLYEANHADYDTVMKFPTGKPHEYFVVENRSQLGFDAGLPASGLAVYHCDRRGSNEFQQGSPLKHYQAALLQADGRKDLEAGLNQGDGGDLYGRIAGVALSHATVPATLTWDGSASGLVISEVGEPGPVIAFQVGEPSVEPTTVTGSSSPDLAIPDNRAGGVADTIQLDGTGTARVISIEVDITHPYVGDLRVELLSPTGRRALLHSRTGGSGDDLHLALDSTPPSPLTPLVGQGVAGAWVLRIADLAGRDTGTLTHWSLAIDTTG